MRTYFTMNHWRVTPQDLYSFNLLAFAGIIGVANTFPVFLAFVAVLPFLWASCTTRLQAFATVFVYYLASARGLPHGTQVFFGAGAPVWLGAVFWLGSSLLLSLPWAALWTRQPTRRALAWRLPLVLTIVALPPLGVIGWCNPLVAAGAMFPGFGWFGLLATIAFMYLTCAMRTSLERFACCLIFAACYFFGLFSPLAVAPGWRGVDTAYGGMASGAADHRRAYTINSSLIAQADSVPENSVTVYPETLAGTWTSATADLWRTVAPALIERSATVAFGAEVPRADGRYDNAIVAIGADAGIKYRQRVPVPFSMWRPFASYGAAAHWFDTGVFELRGYRVAALICYEQLLVWPVLMSLLHEPRAIVAPANSWWARDTSIPDIQRTSLNAWSRLFGVPLIIAFNV